MQWNDLNVPDATFDVFVQGGKETTISIRMNIVPAVLRPMVRFCGSSSGREYGRQSEFEYTEGLNNEFIIMKMREDCPDGNVSTCTILVHWQYIGCTHNITEKWISLYIT